MFKWIILLYGNCWYRAVVQQIHRTEVFQMLEPCKIYDSHYHMWLDVVAFVREQVHVSQAVQNYKQFYEETLRFEYDNMSWEEFLSNQESGRIYCTEIFSLATAVFLSIDIFVTSENSTLAHPYTLLSRFWNHSQSRSPCPMLIGNIHQNHFQSLIPSNEIMQALSCGDREVPIPDIDFTISSQSYSSVCRNLGAVGKRFSVRLAASGR